MTKLNNYKFHSPLRGETLITPCKRSAARGKMDTLSPSALRRSATSDVTIAPLRGARYVGCITYPELRLRLARGYQRGAPTVRRIYGMHKPYSILDSQFSIFANATL